MLTRPTWKLEVKVKKMNDLVAFAIILPESVHEEYNYVLFISLCKLHLVRL